MNRGLALTAHVRCKTKILKLKEASLKSLQSALSDFQLVVAAILAPHLTTPAFVISTLRPALASSAETWWIRFEFLTALMTC